MAEHGTITKYRGGCRCQDCRTAATETAKERRKFWGNPDNYDPTKLWHGTNHGYASYGCRCEDCKISAAEHRQDKKWAEFWR